MALFQDSPPSTLADLVAYESSILDVAATENIDLMAKATLASLDISLSLQRFLNMTPGGRAFQLHQIVSTDGLKHWHALLTIAITYRDAHFRQMNDRHKAKWKEYEHLAREAGRMLFDVGVGVVFHSILKPAPPIIEQVAGVHPARTYFVRIAWVDADGTEGSPSEPASVTTLEGSSITVRPAAPGVGVRGWNVYVGLLDDELTQQNNAPIGMRSTWTLPSEGVSTNGNRPGQGQVAEYVLQYSPVLQRG